MSNVCTCASGHIIHLPGCPAQKPEPVLEPLKFTNPGPEVNDIVASWVDDVVTQIHLIIEQQGTDEVVAILRSKGFTVTPPGARVRSVFEPPERNPDGSMQ